MGQGDWTLETAPSGKGIIKAPNSLTDIKHPWHMLLKSLQTDPKLNMVQVAGLLYPTLVQKPSQSTPSK